MAFLGLCLAICWLAILVRGLAAPHLPFRQHETDFMLVTILFTSGYIMLVGACLLASAVT